MCVSDQIYEHNKNVSIRLLSKTAQHIIIVIRAMLLKCSNTKNSEFPVQLATE